MTRLYIRAKTAVTCKIKDNSRSKGDNCDNHTLIHLFQRLEESVTKNSPYLGRDAIYKKVVSIDDFDKSTYMHILAVTVYCHVKTL